MPEPDDFEGTSRWVDASAEVRSTAKWIATVVAGVGAVIFGAGPILARTELDASSWPFLRVVACVAAAVVGVLGLVLLINALLRAQMPVELNLATLPDTFKQQVAADPSAYLPGNCLTVDEFRTRLRVYQTAAVRLPEQVEAANRDDDKASLQRAPRGRRQEPRPLPPPPQRAARPGRVRRPRPSGSSARGPRWGGGR